MTTIEIVTSLCNYWCLLTTHWGRSRVPHLSNVILAYGLGKWAILHLKRKKNKSRINLEGWGTWKSNIEIGFWFHRIRGDQQHFVRRDELKVEAILTQIGISIDYILPNWWFHGFNDQAAWEIFTPLLHRIDNGEMKPIPYKPGSRGPAEADELLSKSGYVQTHGYIWIPPTL